MEELKIMGKKVSFAQAIFIMLMLLAFVVVGVIVFELDAQIPILLADVVTALIAMANGIKWQALEDSIIKSLASVLQAIA